MLIAFCCYNVSDTNHITALNFMDALDDGLVVCRLAKTIQEQAQQAVDEGRAKGVSSFFNIPRQ
jgi:hypothetical protein